MHIEDYQAYCLQKPGVTETFPLDDQTLVYKVEGRIFTLAGIEPFERINLKCNPEKALELREQFSAVKPGWHMHKKHWNTVHLDGTIPERLLRQWIDDSYKLVVDKLPASVKGALSSETLH